MLLLKYEIIIGGGVYLHFFDETNSVVLLMRNLSCSCQTQGQFDQNNERLSLIFDSEFQITI